jgi:outer membrane protein assembly factor BamE
MLMPCPAYRARLLRHAAGALCAAAVLTGCASSDNSRSGLFTPYRVAVPQGNYLDAATLGQIKPGMSPEQVQFALGTPLLKATLRPNEWHYVFRFQHANGTVDLRRSTIYFAEGRVERVQTDALPSAEQGIDPVLPSSTRRAGRFR